MGGLTSIRNFKDNEHQQWVIPLFHRFSTKRETVRGTGSVLRFQMARKLLQVLKYGETVLQKPGEGTQGQTIVFTSTSQIMEFVLTSKYVGVIFEWFH